MALTGIVQEAVNSSPKYIDEKNFVKQISVLQSLYVIWENVGIDEEQKTDRANKLWKHIFDLLEEIVAEETELFENIKKCIKDYEKEILKLLDELSLPKEEKNVGTLIIREKCLRQRLDELKKIKHKRLKTFQELHYVKLKYCKKLGMPTIGLSCTTGVPSEKDIYELQQCVNALKEEKDRREKKFYVLKKELTTILEVTELTPETSSEKEILTTKEDDLSLSNETFELLEQFVTKTKCKKVELENEKEALLGELSVLWDVLKIQKAEKENFLTKYTSYCVSSLKAIKKEIDRFEGMKRQNINKSINALKEELSLLCEKCFISNSKRLFYTDEVNETILKTYNNEIAKWKIYYKDVEHIIKNIHERQKLLDLMKMLDSKASDSNRYKNRGGNLLQEERDRKKLQKDLPALEEKIFLDIEIYEEKSGKKFLYFGENFQNFVKKQWDDIIAQKENEKKLRQKLQLPNQLEEKKTPAKRPFVSTPNTAPSKLFKASICRTPNFSVLKQTHTTAKMKSNKFQFNSDNGNKRSVLKEKNTNNACSSNSRDTTTYRDFADKLNQSSKYTHHSSFLTSVKVLGKRTGNTSKRITDNTCIQKSLWKKTTPTRGKVGLPFLI